MVATRSRRLARAATLAALLALAMSAPAAAIEVVSWNLLHYPEVMFAGRQQSYRTVMAALDPDVLVCQELNSSAGRDSFLLGVLDVIQPGQWSSQWVNVQSGEGMAVFWKPARVTCFNFSQFDPPSGPRDVFFFGVRPVGYGTPTFFRVYSFHLKAGTTPADSTTRRLEATQIRASLLNAVPAGTHFIIGGDGNIQGDWEGAYIRLTESQADNDGRCKDPLNMPGDWSSSLYAAHHTQCPCVSCPTGDFSGGGLDDRFDLWLTSYPMQDGEGFDLVPSSYKAYGNDGLHYNDAINGDNRNFAVPIEVANALHSASDHIPVVIDIQVPAKVAAESQLDFGSVITGAPASTRTLNVSNTALAPADELTYQLSTAGASFTAPAGTFTASAGAAANPHTITMSAAVVGTALANLTVNCDDPDSAAKVVKLSGNVLAHARPSWDGALVQTETQIDLGSFLQGTWEDQSVDVFNVGFNALASRLSLQTATFIGGDDRFSIAGGVPGLVNGAGTITVHFDEVGATLDSSYNATLQITTADEPLPGATAQATLIAHMVVTPRSGSTGVDPAPAGLRFLPPRPNPVARSTRFAFELPQPAHVALEIFDLGGRRVASVASAEFGAGRHELAWGATDENGARLEGGLYFARFRTRGLDRTERVIVLP